MNFRPVAAALALLVVLCAPSVHAADFSVTPVRIFMTTRDRAIAVTVENEGDEEMVMQAELFAWKQKPGGEDDLTPTEDIVLSPPIVKLAPKSRQVVRLARVGPPPVRDELTYRMIVREVPEVKQGKELKVQLALAFSLPVFVTPNTAKRQLQCQMERAAADTIRAVCENTGNAYAQVRSFALLAGNGDKLATRETGGYILPNIKRTFEIKAPARVPAGKFSLQAGLDDGSSQTFEGTLPD
jgi:fimbrial chaperone protein